MSTFNFRVYTLVQKEVKMVLASQLRAGMAIRFEGQLYRVVAADYHPGQGKMSGQNHTRLRNIDTGTLWDHSFRSELKLEDIPIDKRAMEYLYADTGRHCFMDPATYEQVEIPNELLGPQAAFLESGMRLAIDFVEGRPISVTMPDSLEVRIAIRRRVRINRPTARSSPRNWTTAWR